mgnify:CR=1 FL=1
MKNQLTKVWMISGLLAFATLCVTPALAHHSFAMYDQTKTDVLTGVVYQFVAQANHAEIHFYLIGPDGKLAKEKDGKKVDWVVESAGREARDGAGNTAVAVRGGQSVSVEVALVPEEVESGLRGSGGPKCPW